MNTSFTPARLLGGAILILSLWVVHGFAEALLAAGVITIASWPLYAAFNRRLQSLLGRNGRAALFTVAITTLLLAPMVFAGWALLSETRSLLQGLAAPGRQPVALPGWLAELPLIGPWLGARWPAQLEQLGGLPMRAEHADAGALLGWAHALGQLTFRHALIVAFTVLLMGFLYRHGAVLARDLTAVLRQAIGERVDRFVAVGTRAVRAAVASMLAVALFDGLASVLAYTAAGVPRPLLWAGITGALAAVPFLGYAAVAALALQLMLQGQPTTALLALLLGSAVLLGGDKLVRPLVARGGMQLPFVWVLMGCIGGFGALGLAGLVIGPVALTLAGEMWRQRVQDSAPARR